MIHHVGMSPAPSFSQRGSRLLTRHGLSGEHPHPEALQVLSMTPLIIVKETLTAQEILWNLGGLSQELGSKIKQ